MKEATIRLSRRCSIRDGTKFDIEYVVSAKAWGLEARDDEGGGAAMRWDGCGGGGGGGGGSQMKHRCRSNERGICAVRCSTVQHGAVEYEYNLSLSLSLSLSKRPKSEGNERKGRRKKGINDSRGFWRSKVPVQ